MPDRSFRLIGPSLLSHSNPVGKSGASALPTKVLGCMMLSLCGRVMRPVRLWDDYGSCNCNYSTRKGGGLRVGPAQWNEPDSMSISDDLLAALPRAEAIRDRIPVKVSTSMNNVAENSTTVAPDDTST